MQIRVLTHLDVGGYKYKPGEIMQEAHVNDSFREYASGQRLHGGNRILEFVSEKQAPRPKPKAPVAAPAPDVPIGLRDHILAAVREGATKAALVKSVAKGMGVTQKSVADEFDAVVASGLVTDNNGKLTINEGAL